MITSQLLEDYLKYLFKISDPVITKCEIIGRHGLSIRYKISFDHPKNENMKILCSIRPFDCEHYAGELDGPHYCGLKETDCKYAKQPLREDAIEPLKSGEEILVNHDFIIINLLDLLDFMYKHSNKTFFTNEK